MNVFPRPLAVIGLFLGLLALTLPPTETPPVRVTGGLISGTVNREGDVRIYRGIPFAAPPVGELRWKAPQPVRPWTGVRRCEAFGPSPVQGVPNPFGPWSAEYLIPKEPISEDCLYLNVWTAARPVSAKSLRPVLVWIYGGGFSSGGSAVPIYDGEAMARKGVVFVSLNYRVGPFGFLAHPALSAESGRNVSGNYGLLDQIAALQWVKQNIAQLGGDPGQVTIAGQSAGSTSVNCLVASPLARNLFNKAIAQSGAIFTRTLPTLRQAEEAGMQFMKTVGASSIAELRAKPAAEIQQKSEGGNAPIVDGYLLPASIARIFADRKQNPVALMTGWNEDEGLNGTPKSAADFRAQLEKQYGPESQNLLKHYPAGDDTEAARSQRNYGRDYAFGVKNYAWATLQSQQGQPVYVYRFTRKLPATGQYAHYGAFHTGEVAYAYDNLRYIDRQLRPLNETDAELARQMSAYWANFIKTGNPNGKGLPPWPAYSVQKKQIAELGDRTGPRTLPDGEALDFLYSLLKRND
ncbi:carboxylesterase/lipase family protein [Tellurirhabdus rosea]|uniref:carboxylesterase/lipase family protein n=1 Tax=Tellurirhabdus rosea TaxID=2674997 RepID=UPI00224FC20F|nr:carboxylesterase family protein [Tellurirhabdus rosea]